MGAEQTRVFEVATPREVYAQPVRALSGIDQLSARAELWLGVGYQI